MRIIPVNHGNETFETLYGITLDKMQTVADKLSKHFGYRENQEFDQYEKEIALVIVCSNLSSLMVNLFELEFGIDRTTYENKAISYLVDDFLNQGTDMLNKYFTTFGFMLMAHSIGQKDDAIDQLGDIFKELFK